MRRRVKLWGVLGLFALAGAFLLVKLVGTARALTPASSSSFQVSDKLPVWSPDGSKLALARTYRVDPGNSGDPLNYTNIILVNDDGTRQRPVFDNMVLEQAARTRPFARPGVMPPQFPKTIDHLYWLPDGQSLLCLDSNGVWRVSLTGTAQRLISLQQLYQDIHIEKEGDCSRYERYALSPDGHLLAFHLPSVLGVLDTKTGAIRLFRRGLTAHAQALHWSKDSKTLTTVFKPPHPALQIDVQRGTCSATPITSASGSKSAPVGLFPIESPSGKWLAETRMSRTGSPDVYLRTPSNSATRLVMKNAYLVTWVTDRQLLLARVAPEDEVMNIANIVRFATPYHAQVLQYMLVNIDGHTQWLAKGEAPRVSPAGQAYVFSRGNRLWMGKVNRNVH